MLTGQHKEKDIVGAAIPGLELELRLGPWSSLRRCDVFVFVGDTATVYLVLGSGSLPRGSRACIHCSPAPGTRVPGLHPLFPRPRARHTSLGTRGPRVWDPQGPRVPGPRGLEISGARTPGVSNLIQV